MSSKFGTSGLRGLATSLLDVDAARYVQAFCRYAYESRRMRAGDPVLLGWDLRESSPAIAEICRIGLQRAGFRPLVLGDVPTPALALYASDRKIAGLMVTGSHIPADRNGIKFYLPDGEITKADEGAIADLAGALPHPQKDIARAATIEGTSRFLALQFYQERYASLLPGSLFRGLRIGIFEHSSVARDALHLLFQSMGATTVPLGRSRDFIALDTEAVSPSLQHQLRQWAKDEDCFAIVSTDADGDRPLLTDENGTVIRGDTLGLLTARFLGAERVITPVTSTTGVERAGSWQVVRTAVGSPYVIEAMKQALDKGTVGFEANGGVLVTGPLAFDGRPLRPLLTRDGFLPLLAACALAVGQGQSLAALVADLKLPANLSDRLEDYRPQRSAALLKALKSDDGFRARFLDGFAPVASSDHIDGVRLVLADAGIVHLRASGNAPELRCYVEHDEPGQAHQMLSACLQRAAAFVEE